MKSWEFSAFCVVSWDMQRINVKFDLQWSMMTELDNGRQKLERNQEGKEEGLFHGG
jgi:hypothetical protein